MTAPIIPPAGRNPASPGQRKAARDHLTRLRQQGGTYRSIAAACCRSFRMSVAASLPVSVCMM